MRRPPALKWPLKRHAVLALSRGITVTKVIQLAYEALCQQHPAFTKFHIGRWWARRTAQDITAKAILELGWLSQ